MSYKVIKTGDSYDLLEKKSSVVIQMQYPDESNRSAEN